MHIEISLDSILERLNQSLLKVKHITAFIKEETLKTFIIYAIIMFLATSLFIIGLILLRRTRALIRNKKKKVLVEKYENFLSETITYIYENNKIFEKKTYAITLNIEDQTNTFNRQILLEQILLMRKHVGGEEVFTLRNLYERLGFHKASLKKTKSLLWHTRLEGLQELLLMSANNIENTIMRMLGDSNPFIRIEAMRALILQGHDWQPALIRYSYPLSAWEQYQICDALSRVQNIMLPDFTPLLTSYNPTVLLFGLRMIKHFHCMEAIPKVEPFLVHLNPLIVDAAKQVMVQFGFDDELLAEMNSVSSTDLNVEDFTFDESTLLTQQIPITESETQNIELLLSESLDTEGVELIDTELIMTIKPKIYFDENALMREIMIATMELRLQIAEDNKKALFKQVMAVTKEMRVQLGLN